METVDVAAILIAVTLVLDKIIGMLKSRGIDLQRLSRQVDDLHEWHSQTDEDGVRVWYVRQSLEKAIDRLARTIEAQTKLLDRIDRRLERVPG